MTIEVPTHYTKIYTDSIGINSNVLTEQKIKDQELEKIKGPAERAIEGAGERKKIFAA